MNVFSGRYTVTKLVDDTITEELKNDVRTFYQSIPMSLKQLSAISKLSIQTLKSEILVGIPQYSRSRIFNPYLKEDYFENIDTQEKAYFLGLIIADGNVFDPKDSPRHDSMWTSITLDEADVYLLEKFREEVGLSSVVASDGRGARYVAVRSDKMAEDLAKYYIVPRKSYITHFPFNVPKEMCRHVIRGIFDGDGSIEAKGNIISKDGRCRFRHKMSFCGSHRLMEELIGIIDESTSISFPVHVYDYTTRHLSEFGYGNRHDMRNFGLWIYDGAAIYMKRKRDLFDKFMTHYNMSYDVNIKDDCGTVPPSEKR